MRKLNWKWIYESLEIFSNNDGKMMIGDFEKWF